MKNILVLGGGSWGTALATLLADKGHRVEMWLRNKDQVEDIRVNRENRKYLPGKKFSQNLTVTNELKSSIKNKDIIMISVPTQGVREVLMEIKEEISPEQIIVNVSKGVENNSLLRISQIVEELIPENEYVILSGPSHAEEVARDMATTVVVAGENPKITKEIQEVFTSPSFRVYTNDDVVGVELGGSLKNVIALGAGISDGLGYGDNTKAALMTRGIFEMAKLGEKMGARKSTFSGLSGIGDLIVTCTSMHSRNRRAGILIGQGKPVDLVVEEIGMVVEGIKTTKSVYELSRLHGIEMPITQEIYRVIYEGADVRESVPNLMGRRNKHEHEEIL